MAGRVTRSMAAKRARAENGDISDDEEAPVRQPKKPCKSAVKKGKLPQRPFRFLNLPAELRNAVYERVNDGKLVGPCTVRLSPNDDADATDEEVESDSDGEHHDEIYQPEKKGDFRWRSFASTARAPRRKRNTKAKGKSPKLKMADELLSATLDNLSRVNRQLRNETRVYRCESTRFAFDTHDLVEVVRLAPAPEDAPDLLPSYWEKIQYIAINYCPSLLGREFKDGRPVPLLTQEETSILHWLFKKASKGDFKEIQLRFPLSVYSIDDCQHLLLQHIELEIILATLVEWILKKWDNEVTGRFTFARMGEPNRKQKNLKPYSLVISLKWSSKTRDKVNIAPALDTEPHLRTHEQDKHAEMYHTFWDRDESLAIGLS